MKVFITAFLLMITGCIYAQYTLEAVVLDGMTRKPVVNANVYLDGTTKGTTTDEQGMFRLIVSDIINTSLVISHISYGKVIIQDPFVTLPKVIFLEEFVETIPEVMIKAKINKRKREEMLNLFKEYFLGNRASSCRILNEKDILMIHDQDKQEIIATALKPLEIMNNYLKYLIRFDLIEFRVNAQDISLIGTAKLTDIGNNSKTLTKRRETTYYKSFRHFFYLLANDKIKVNEVGEPDLSVNFHLFKFHNQEKNVTFYNQDNAFFMSASPDDPSMKTIVINPEMKAVSPYFFQSDIFLDQIKTIASDNASNVSDNISILKNSDTSNEYKSVIVTDNKNIQLCITPSNNQGEYNLSYHYRLSGSSRKGLAVLGFKYSTVNFLTDTFHVDIYGNTDLYKNFKMLGDFGLQRISELLPLDYLPDQPDKTLTSSTSFKEEIPESVEERMRYYLERQTMTYPQEKIHVHTDKTHYVAGETLWFRAYLTDYGTNAPCMESNYVYGELYDPADSLAMRVKIRQDAGAFKGYFDLPPNLAEGHYRLRFYTRYMEEAGEEFFFYKDIFVGNAFSKIHPVEESYRNTAMRQDSQDMEKLHELPEAKAEAETVTMRAVQSKDSLIVETIVSDNSLQSDSIRLFVQCRGVIYRNEMLPTGGKISIANDSLPSGVIQLLLLDSKLNILSERLVFNLNDKDLARINLTPSKENYRKREQVELSVELMNHDNEPLHDNFSISVTSDVVPPESNIYTLLLTSELKGYLKFKDEKSVEEINHLLFTQRWNRYNMSDIFKGYIKIPTNLREMTPELSGQISYGMLQGRKTGQFVRITAAGIDNILLSENIAEVVDKKFEIDYNEYPNGTSYMLQTGPDPTGSKIRPDPTVYPQNSLKPPYAYNMEKKATETFLLNTAKIFEPYREGLYRFHDAVFTLGDASTGMSPLSPGRSGDIIISRSELWNNKKMTLRQLLSSFDDITIRSDENGTLHLRYLNGINYYDYVVVADDRWFNAYSTSLTDPDFHESAAYSLESLLSLTNNRIEEVEIIHAPAPPITLKTFGNLVVNDPELYGINESLSPIQVISPKEVKNLSHPGYMGTILITTMDRNGGISDALTIAPLGYQSSRDFYSPVYETKEQKESPAPDLRTTIYWNPDVQTDDEGKAKISFYAPDVPTTYTITIEGITKDGLLIHKTGKIVIK